MTARARHTSEDGRKGGRRFWSNASGASALEFALVAVPFILLVLAVLEVGIVYFADSML
ncbi:MAG: TadE/TadG family type IV pilus assembly protein, partial [Methyloceanibacter sp.]